MKVRSDRSAMFDYFQLFCWFLTIIIWMAGVAIELKLWSSRWPARSTCMYVDRICTPRPPIYGKSPMQYFLLFKSIPVFLRNYKTRKAITVLPSRYWEIKVRIAAGLRYYDCSLWIFLLHYKLVYSLFWISNCYWLALKYSKFVMNFSVLIF